MQRRELIRSAVGLATIGALRSAQGTGAASEAHDCPYEVAARAAATRAQAAIRVAFLISEDATVIDFCGPWEVFQDVMLHGAGDMHHPFELYTVAEDMRPVRVTGGMRITPEYTLDNAPSPHVLVVPAMRGTERSRAWIRKVSGTNQLTMSVCTGAFQLARAGLLDGLSATTHHDYLEEFAREFPRVKLERDVRFVEHERVATAAGLTSGIDLALRVVERYFDRDVAQATATYLEHESTRWKVAQPRGRGVHLVA
jgi:transcriptional regulator GlxA family with amidase domain